MPPCGLGQINWDVGRTLTCRVVLKMKGKTHALSVYCKGTEGPLKGSATVTAGSSYHNPAGSLLLQSAPRQPASGLVCWVATSDTHSVPVMVPCPPQTPTLYCG